MRKITLFLLFTSASLWAQTFSGMAGDTIRIAPPFKACFGIDNGQDACFIQTGVQTAKLAGFLDFAWVPKTVATLPSAAANIGRTFRVTDGNSASDCTVGLGSSSVLCTSNGAWIPLGSAGGGTNNPGGSPNQIQLNGGTAFGAYALTGLLKTSGGVPAVAVGADVVAIFSGTCNSAAILRGDASCTAGPVGAIVGTSDTQSLTNKNLTGAGNTFPTFNQNTSGTSASAGKWTTPRTLGGNSVDGSANVAFANKFIAQGTTDSGLSGAQFLGALASGLVVDTTTTGILSTVAAPSGAVVGTTDSQTLSNKTINFGTLNGGLVNPAFVGPGANNNRCQVDGTTHTTIASCATLQGGTTGYRSQIIESNIPEVITTNPIPINFSPEIYLGPGIKSLNCDSTNPNCWVLEVPLILPAGSTIKGTGTVTIGNAGPGDMSGGTVIATGNNWPPPLGVPTVSAPTCGVSGGSLTNGNYFITIRTANNLQTNGGTAVAGPSMHTSEFTVNCANGGAAQSISVTSPSAVGNSPFNAKDYQVAAATATGQEQIQARDTTNMACTAGIVSTFNGVNYGCLMGATATIKTIQTATRFFEDTDHSNDAIVIVPNQTVGFNVQMYGFTFSCGPVNSVNSFNMPNWAIWNQAGEELTGVTPTGLNLTAGCGGYATGTPATGGSATAFSGGYIYEDTHGPNSILEHIALGGGATSASATAPFYPIYMDGRFDTSGSAAGVPRSVKDITVTPKSGNDVGHTPAYSPAAIYVTGARARVHFSDIHIENTVPTTGDGIQCDNGAYCLFDAIEGQNATIGKLVHCTATAGFCGGYGLCAIGTANSGQDRCAGQGQTGAAATFQDDRSGGVKLLGFVGHFSTIVSNFKFVGLAPMTFTNLSAIYPCSATTEGYEGAVTDDNTALAFNATITGGGANHVHAYCNGTNWVMQ